MKACILSLILSSIFLPLAAQQQFSIEVENTPLEEVIMKLERDYDLLFSYMNEDVENIKIALRLQSNNLNLILNSILEDTDLTHEIIDGNYVILTNKAEANKQTICGYILDGATSQPLPFANIIVEDSTLGTTSNEDGYFEISSHFSTQQRICVSYIGFEDRRLSIQNLLSKDCTRIALIIDEQMTPFLIIKDYIIDGINLTENGSSTFIQPQKIGNMPGQVEANVMRTIQFLPGVSAPSSKASDIFIRGGTPDQNLILWEDIPIYHSAHYFGMISAIDPYTVDHMEIYRGGFGAEYGGRVSGVIDIKAGDESDDNRVGIGTNMTHAYMYGLHKMGIHDNTAVAFSLRRSYSELGETPTFNNISKVNQQGFIIGNNEVASLPDHIRITNDFNFIDSHLKISSQLNDSDRLEIAGLYAHNDFVDQITDNRMNAEQKDDMTIQNLGLSMKWKHKWSDNLNTTVKGILTSYNYDYTYRYNVDNRNGSLFRGDKDNKIGDRQLALISQYTTDRDQIFELGYQWIHYDIDFLVEEDTRGRGDFRDTGSSQSSLHCLYGSYKNPITQKLGMNLGLRSSYYDNRGGDVYIEPRARLSYELSDHINISVNYGRHYQFVSQVTEFKGSDGGLSLPLWSLAEQSSIPVQKASLYQIGALYQISGFVFDLQVYKKSIDGLSSRAYDFDIIDNGKPLTGSADIRGVDLLVKKRFSHLRTWLSYSYSKAELQFNRLQGGPFPSDYDQRHVLQWANQYRWNDIQFSLGVKLASGLPYSQIVDFKAEGNRPGEDQEFVAIYDGINQHNLPTTEEVNFSITYQWMPIHTRWISYFSLGITNALDTENLYNRSYYLSNTPLQQREVSIESLEKSNLRFTPNVSIRFEW